MRLPPVWRLTAPRLFPTRPLVARSLVRSMSDWCVSDEDAYSASDVEVIPAAKTKKAAAPKASKMVEHIF